MARSGGIRRSHARAASERLLGKHSVREALAARRRELHAVLVRSGKRPADVESLVSRAEALGVRVREVDPAELARGLGPQDRVPAIALDAGPLPEVDLSILSAGAAGGRMLVALDGIEDPQNLGAIARVAEGAGAGGLILQERRSPPLSPAAVRASAGALEWLPVARVTNLPRTLEELAALGFWAVGADLEGVDLFAVPDRVFAGDLVVVLGAEGKGLRPIVREKVDHPVRIPMAGRVESLNVATAAAVVLFELTRRRRVE